MPFEASASPQNPLQELFLSSCFALQGEFDAILFCYRENASYLRFGKQGERAFNRCFAEMKIVDVHDYIKDLL